MILGWVAPFWGWCKWKGSELLKSKVFIALEAWMCSANSQWQYGDNLVYSEKFGPRVELEEKSWIGLMAPYQNFDGGLLVHGVIEKAKGHQKHWDLFSGDLEQPHQKFQERCGSKQRRVMYSRNHKKVFSGWPSVWPVFYIGPNVGDRRTSFRYLYQ